MKTISREQLQKKAREYWNAGNSAISKSFNHIIGGHIISVNSITVIDNHNLFIIIIHNPKVKLEDYHISLIADACGGSLTEGKILYQRDYAYITWSNWSQI